MWEAACFHADSGVGLGGNEGVHLKGNAMVPRPQGRPGVCESGHNAGWGPSGSRVSGTWWKAAERAGPSIPWGEVGHPQQ